MDYHLTSPKKLIGEVSFIIPFLLHINYVSKFERRKYMKVIVNSYLRRIGFEAEFNKTLSEVKDIVYKMLDDFPCAVDLNGEVNIQTHPYKENVFRIVINSLIEGVAIYEYEEGSDPELVSAMDDFFFNNVNSIKDFIEHKLNTTIKIDRRLLDYDVASLDADIQFETEGSEDAYIEAMNIEDIIVKNLSIFKPVIKMAQGVISGVKFVIGKVVIELLPDEVIDYRSKYDDHNIWEMSRSENVAIDAIKSAMFDRNKAINILSAILNEGFVEDRDYVRTIMGMYTN